MINLSHFVVVDKILFRGQNQQNHMEHMPKNNVVNVLSYVLVLLSYVLFKKENQKQEKTAILC